MKRACLQQNTNTYEQNHASSIRPLKINFVRMKHRFLILSFIAAALISGVFTSCEKDDDGPAATETKTLILSTKDYTVWHYFSFSQDKVIGTGSADPANGDDAAWKQRTDWDIAFHYKDIRTNSGKSGIGQGGMLEASSSVFADVLEAPATGYTVDDSLYIRLSAAMPPVYTSSTGSSVCLDWARYNHGERAWVFAEKVFIVKTADGKYAKIWLKSFLDDADVPGTITMDYAYQADGSTSLK